MRLATEHGSSSKGSVRDGRVQRESARANRWRSASTMAQRFDSYGLLENQKQMLQDATRTSAYRDAIVGNPANFAGKVVLDLGAGTGILSVFAARAGASRVYAVEATAAAEAASQVVRSCGLAGVITVIRGSIEEITMSEKVDIIISEWMGAFLLRESMIESLIYARDTHLKADGAMYPSHAAMHVAPASIPGCIGTDALLHDRVAGWLDFVRSFHSTFDVNLDCLSELYKEQAARLLAKSSARHVDPASLVGQSSCVMRMNLRTVLLADVASFHARFRMEGKGGVDPIDLNALVGWFDVSFNGSVSEPSHLQVELETEPKTNGATHWLQECFVFPTPLQVKGQYVLEGVFGMEHKREGAHDSHKVHVDCVVSCPASSFDAEPITGLDWTMD